MVTSYFNSIINSNISLSQICLDLKNIHRFMGMICHLVPVLLMGLRDLSNEYRS